MLAGSSKNKKTSTESTEYSGVYRIFYQSRPTQNKNLKCITTKSPIRFSKFTIFVRPSKSPEKSPPLPLHLVQLTLAASIHRTGAGRFANQLSGFCHRVAIVLLCGVCVCMYVTMICIQLHQVGCLKLGFFQLSVYTL